MSKQNFMNELSDRLTELLEEHNMSASRLASEINKGKSTITKIKNGDSQSSKHTISLIANFFGVNYNWLLTGIGAKYENTTAAGSESNTEKTVRQNLSKTELINRIEVMNFKGNTFIKTSYNRYLLLVPVMDEMSQDSFFKDPFQPIDFDDYNKYPLMLDEPTSGVYLGFSRNSVTRDKHLLWNVLEKKILVIGREIPRDSWHLDYTFYSHRLYITISNKGINIREVVSPPNSDGVAIVKYLNDEKQEVTEELVLKECSRIFSVVNLCHDFN